MREFIIDSRDHLKKLGAAINAAFDAGFADNKKVLMTLQRPRRNSLTNAKLHAMIGDIRAQACIKIGVHVLDKAKPLEVWKSLLVRWFDLELVELGEPLTKRGERIFDLMYAEWVYMRPSTTEFSQKECGKFIEWLYAFGVNNGVKFTEKALDVYAEYRELNCEQ